MRCDKAVIRLVVCPQCSDSESLDLLVCRYILVANLQVKFKVIGSKVKVTRAKMRSRVSAFD